MGEILGVGLTHYPPVITPVEDRGFPLTLALEKNPHIPAEMKDPLNWPEGLREEDVLVQLDDQPITNTGELSKFLLDHPPGTAVTVGFLRGGQALALELTLGERPNR